MTDLKPKVRLLKEVVTTEQKKKNLQEKKKLKNVKVLSEDKK